MPFENMPDDKGNNMNIIISNESLREATKCGKGFVCIQGEPTDICKVEKFVDNKLSFLKCLNNNGGCNYHIRYGFDNILCSCPIRNELFRKYNA